MRRYMYVLSILAILSAGVSSFAGETGTHGGDVVKCKGKPPIVLDYYHATLSEIGSSTPPATFNISGMTRDEIIELFKNQLKNTALNWDFWEALGILGPIEKWLSSSLKDVDDSNEPYVLPSGCTLLQAAVRQGDAMYGDPLVISTLSPAQQGILTVHEALYYLAQKLQNVSTSESVRTLIRVLLNTESTQEQINVAVKSFGKDFLVEKLWGKEYFPNQPTCGLRFVGKKDYMTLYAKYIDHPKYGKCRAKTKDYFTWECAENHCSPRGYRELPEFYIEKDASFIAFVENGKSLLFYQSK